MSLKKVLVLCATGKAGRNVCRALKDAGFQVFGTTRSNTKKLSDQGVIPVLCDYTSREDLEFLQDTLPSKFMDSTLFVMSNRQWIWNHPFYSPKSWVQELGCLHQKDSAIETIRCGYIIGGFLVSDTSIKMPVTPRKRPFLMIA